MRKLAEHSAPSLVVDGRPGFSQVAVKFRNFAEEAALLRKMVNHFSGDLALKEFTLKVLRDAGAEPKHELDQALAIGEWAQQNLYYVHEARETFWNPRITLRMMAGDCDKFTVLICSMLGTIGIREKMAILQINGRWAHIFPVAVVVQDGEAHRLTLDATLDADRYPIRALTNPIKLVRDRGDTCQPLFV
jgi:hypothetical protein